MADELIRLDTTIIAIDNLINEAATGTMARTLFTVKDTIYNQQRYVIDAQPVKRGRWIKQEGFWNKNTVKCSLCGNYLDMNGVNGGRSDANYCPNCGARMNGDAE